MSLKPDEYIAISAEEKRAMEQGVKRWREAAKRNEWPDGSCACCKVAAKAYGARCMEMCNVCPLAIYQDTGDTVSMFCVEVFRNWSAAAFDPHDRRERANAVADYIEEVLAHCEVEP